MTTRVYETECLIIGTGIALWYTTANPFIK